MLSLEIVRPAADWRGVKPRPCVRQIATSRTGPAPFAKPEAASRKPEAAYLPTTCRTQSASRGSGINPCVAIA